MAKAGNKAAGKRKAASGGEIRAGGAGQKLSDDQVVELAEARSRPLAAAERVVMTPGAGGAAAAKISQAALRVEMASIESLTVDPGNARRHGGRNLEAIVESLRRFGQQKPIVVDQEGVIRAGNGTYAAAKTLGWTEIAVTRSNLSEKEIRAFAIADNRSSELAEWDPDALVMQLGDMDAVTTAALGFSDKEIKKMMGGLSAGAGAGLGVDALAEKWEVVIECGSEAEQKKIFEKLTAEGKKCRVLTL